MLKKYDLHNYMGKKGYISIHVFTGYKSNVHKHVHILFSPSIFSYENKFSLF